MEGDYEKSGFQAASNGDKSFFYYYPLAELENECIKNHFKKIDLIHVKYNKNISKEEIHTVLILKK